jgi:hypothetical protein
VCLHGPRFAHHLKGESGFVPGATVTIPFIDTSKVKEPYQLNRSCVILLREQGDLSLYPAHYQRSFCKNKQRQNN